MQVPVPVHVLLPPRLEWPSVEQDAGNVHGSPAWVWQALPFGMHRASVPQVWSAQAVAQQMLFVPLLMQTPLMQSLGAVQLLPAARGDLHARPMQTKPGAHTVAALAAVQLVAHALPVQR